MRYKTPWDRLLFLSRILLSVFLYSIYDLKNNNGGLHLYASFLAKNKVPLKPGEPFESAQCTKMVMKS